jgi:hypothetical protein
MKTIVILASVLVLSGAALAQQPGVNLPAPTFTPLPPALPPAPVPSVVTPPAPLPGVTFQSGPAPVPGGSTITPSYRYKATYKRRCKNRPGRRCRTS